jgi:hypothetical protein
MSSLIGNGVSNTTKGSVVEIKVKLREIVVIVGGASSGNPFGHVAIAFEGQGVYSYGTGNDPVGGKGTSLLQYLKKQTAYRSSTAFFIRATDKQLNAMVGYLNRLPSTIPDVRKEPKLAYDTCASRTNESLRVGGFDDPRRDPVSLLFFPNNSSNFPADSYVIGKSYAHETLKLPQGQKFDESRFSKFEP